MQRRGIARVLCLTAAMLAAPACRDDAQKTLAAADEAAWQGDAQREEALLGHLLARLNAQGKRRAQPDADADATRRQLLERLARLHALYLSEPQQAVQNWQALLALSPPAEEAGHALVQLADLYRHQLNLPDTAATCLRQAADVLGSRVQAAEARQALVETYMALGNFNAAAEAAREILTRWPSGAEATHAQLSLGQALLAEHDYPAATEAFARLLERRPEPAVAALAMAEIGRAYQEQGEGAQALDYYHGALKAHPNAPMVQDAIARLRAHMLHLAANRTILNANRVSQRVAKK